jgi:hypothetical protein
MRPYLRFLDDDNEHEPSLFVLGDVPTLDWSLLAVVGCVALTSIFVPTEDVSLRLCGRRMNPPSSIALAMDDNSTIPIITH